MEPRGFLAVVEPDARALPFGYDASDRDQQTFYVCPSDIGGRRLGKYRFQRFRLSAVHLEILPNDCTSCNQFNALPGALGLFRPLAGRSFNLEPCVSDRQFDTEGRAERPSRSS